MVCEKCQKKLSKIVVPDKWKDGARNVVGGKDGGRKAGKIGSKKKFKTSYDPLGRKCRICKSKTQNRAHYCQGCAYQKGICAMCGRKVAVTKYRKMSAK